MVHHLPFVPRGPRRAPRAPLWALLVAAGLVLSRPALADEKAAPAPRVPQRSDSSIETHERAAMGESKDDARRAIESLRAEGGIRATQVLVRIARRGMPCVRAPAIRALGQVGIRTHAVLALLRERATDVRRVAERAAALDALGRLGAGPDVPLLVRALKAERGSIRTIAFRSIQRLSGEPLPDAPSRVAQWWRRHDAVQRPILTAALAGLERAVLEGRARDTRHRRETISRIGWIDVALVDGFVHRWITAGDGRLRDEALRAIAVLRLGDRAAQVRSELRRRGGAASSPALVEAVHALGLPPL